MTFGIGNMPASGVLNGFKMELADIISQFAKHNKIKGHPACPIVPVLGALTPTDAVEIITPAVLLPITNNLKENTVRVAVHVYKVRAEYCRVFSYRFYYRKNVVGDG